MLLSANLSLMFTELPLPERFAAARAAGFDCVEIQFPYGHDAHVLKAAAGDMPIDLINVPAGAPERGDFGLAVDTGRKAEFAAAVDQALAYAAVLGARKINVLCGAPPAGQSEATTLAVAIANLHYAAGRMQQVGVLALAEMINPFDMPGFWLCSLAKALDVIGQAAHPNLKLQFDLYHMARTEPDLVRAVHIAGAQIGHMQFADSPGRHEPGTGSIDFVAARQALAQVGYTGVEAAEYRPAVGTVDGLGWMAGWRQGRVHPLPEG